MKTIAIVDDDVYIGDMIDEMLQREGYTVIRAYSGTEALYLLESHHPDLILLDLMLPGISGEEVLSRVQDTPVIVISAKVDIESKVDLLMSGAIDYLTKPFDTKELLARIAVQFRKEKYNSNPNVIKAGALVMEEDIHQVCYNGVVIKTTKTEYAILKILIINQNRTISKAVILDRIAEETLDCTEDSLKQHISNLRVKIRNASQKDMIQAVWGIGYKLVTE